jgi:hypothetical protein
VLPRATHAAPPRAPRGPAARPLALKPCALLPCACFLSARRGAQVSGRDMLQAAAAPAPGSTPSCEQLQSLTNDAQNVRRRPSLRAGAPGASPTCSAAPETT